MEYFADAERFLTASQTSSKMQKQGLTAQPLEATKSVRVESLHPTVGKGTNCRDTAVFSPNVMKGVDLCIYSCFSTFIVFSHFNLLFV